MLGLAITHFVVTPNRTHRTIRLFNEICGKVVINFSTFFLIILTVDYQFAKPIPKFFIAAAIVYFLVWITRLSNIEKQDKKIRSFHHCDSEDFSYIERKVAELYELFKHHSNDIRYNQNNVRVDLFEKLDVFRKSSCNTTLSFWQGVQVCWLNFSVLILSLVMAYLIHAWVFTIPNK